MPARYEIFIHLLDCCFTLCSEETRDQPGVDPPPSPDLSRYEWEGSQYELDDPSQGPHGCEAPGPLPRTPTQCLAYKGSYISYNHINEVNYTPAKVLIRYLRIGKS